MLFRKKKNAGTIFSQYYQSMLKIARTSDLSHYPDFELLPAMFIVADFASACAGKDRQSIANSIFSKIKSLYPDFLVNSKFDIRCDLYAEIIKGKQPRCDWFLGNPDDFCNHAVSKCVALLGDILWNPHCADDYDNAPMLLHGAFDALTFTESVMIPILNEFVAFFKAIYDF